MERLRGPFSSAPACFYHASTHLHTWVILPPFTAPPSLTDGAHLSGPSSPNPPCSALACHRVGHTSSAHTTSMPTFHLPSWAIASPSRDVKRHVMLLIALLSPVAAPAEMHAPGAQRWSLAPPAPLVELMRTKVHRLGPYVALLART
jgi:hypothetical protein